MLFRKVASKIFFELIEKRRHHIQFQLRPFYNASGPLSKFKSSQMRANSKSEVVQLRIEAFLMRSYEDFFSMFFVVDLSVHV